jgi:hypothetical protein
MRSFLLASATAVTLVSGFSFGAIAVAQPSSGSYQKTCQHPTIVNGVLTAECTDINHKLHVSSLPGYLQCQGDISNQNGVLSCNRAPPNTAVGIVPNNNGQRGNSPQAGGRSENYSTGNNGNGRRNSDNQYNGGKAQEGASNSGSLYSRGFSYPDYGDQRYGDPRFDPRFAQGGYAYGRQAKQWVPIAERAQWLDQRIMRGEQEGTVDRREARGLHQELNGILSLENRYRREGMNARKYTDLDRRFDLLAARIQYERNDGDHTRDLNRR